MAGGNRKQQILEALRNDSELGSNQLGRQLGLTRQALNRHIKDLIRGGDIVRSGTTRGTRYRLTADGPAPFVSRTYAVAGLAEDAVLAELEPLIPGGLNRNARGIFRYAFTEMLNNAIDHSRSRHVVVELKQDAKQICFIVRDAGVGVYKKIARAKRLRGSLAAVNELMKGKLTTQPARHSGEGIFFSSKALSRFVLESGDLRLTCDNRISDVSLTDLKPSQKGTIVRGEVDRQTRIDLRRVFGRYTTEEYGFSKTRLYVKLLEHGTDFVSRSEAKRLLARLESFTEVTLDFKGVTNIGQGFADEVFRVFARTHPAIRLKPVNMARAVGFMVKRAR